MASDDVSTGAQPERPRGPVRTVRQLALGYFERRFGDLFAHVTNESGDTRRLVVGELQENRRLLSDVREQVQPGVAALVEAAIYLEQTAGRLEDELRREAAALIATAQAADLYAVLAKDPAVGYGLVELVARTPLEELPAWAAEMANLFASHRSPLAEAGLWINDPVSVRAMAGGAEVGSVNERIVEVPYVLAAVADSPPGPALDVGAAESTVSLSLASSGRRTYALDPRGYPFRHPLLETVTCPVEEWEGPADPLSAVISLSTIEHLGLGSYRQATAGGDADRDALEVMARWLAPDGRLVLTAPYGTAAVDDFQRVYDAEGIERLVAGWDLVDLRFARRVDDTTWERCEAADLGGAELPGVVLLQARRSR